MSKLDAQEREKMLDLAYQAMKQAYTPYSLFQVCACIRGANGEYYLGCNI